MQTTTLPFFIDLVARTDEARRAFETNAKVLDIVGNGLSLERYRKFLLDERKPAGAPAKVKAPKLNKAEERKAAADRRAVRPKRWRQDPGGASLCIAGV